MSEGKGEALSESLAGLSVAEPTAAPTEADTGSLSSEAAPKPHAGDKIQGVVNWFNVAKGFGTAHLFSSVACTFLSSRAIGGRDANSAVSLVTRIVRGVPRTCVYVTRLSR